MYVCMYEGGGAGGGVFSMIAYISFDSLHMSLAREFMYVVKIILLLLHT